MGGIMCECAGNIMLIRSMAASRFMGGGHLSEMESEVLWGGGCYSLSFIQKHPHFLRNSGTCDNCTEKPLIQKILEVKEKKAKK